MANNLAGNPWVLDTAAVTNIWNQTLFPTAIEWSGYTDAAHTCIIKDARGVEVVNWKGTTDLSPRSIEPGIMRMRGFIVDTLGSGKIKVWHR